MGDVCVADLGCGYSDPNQIPNEEFPVDGMSVVLRFLAKFLDFCVFANQLVGHAECTD